MPCDSVQTSRVDIGKVDPGLLGKAMQELGYSANEYRHDVARGQVIITSPRGASVPTQANIAQAYSAQVVRATARKMGWQCKPIAGKKFEYEIIKH